MYVLYDVFYFIIINILYILLYIILLYLYYTYIIFSILFPPPPASLAKPETEECVEKSHLTSVETSTYTLWKGSDPSTHHT